MKKHAIIPIFIPHKGCPNDCVFCNQRRITAHTDDVTVSDMRKTVDTYMSTLKDMELDEIELSFFGGSFTGLSINEQNMFLEVAKEYKEKGIIQKIHLSTRPDYISDEILTNLKNYSVDTIELGVQSFSDDVLAASNRGHKADCVYKACELIKSYGFTLGIQLMIGLPEDDLEKDIFSAKEAVKIKPHIARLYPTVVIKDTKLYDAMLSGEYEPMAEADAVHRTAKMYRILTEAGINVIRVGLKSSDLIGDEIAFHPAFRQLVESLIAREDIESELEKIKALRGNDNPRRIDLISNPDSINNLIGHKASNKKYFEEKYPDYSFQFVPDNSLEKGKYQVKVSK